MMRCGHAANAQRRNEDGDTTPCCVICWPEEGAAVVAANPDLTGRTMRCDCGKELASSTSGAFFEYRGPGSAFLADHCQTCNYCREVHDPQRCSKCRGTMVNGFLTCSVCGGEGTLPARQQHEFRSRVIRVVDSFYCGCRGWD